MLNKVAVAVLHDLDVAYRLLTGDLPVKAVPGLTEAEVRNKMALDVVRGVGATLATALEIAAQAEMAMGMMVALAGPGPAVEVVEGGEKDKEPFGFAAYAKSKEQAAKAA